MKKSAKILLIHEEAVYCRQGSKYHYCLFLSVRTVERAEEASEVYQKSKDGRRKDVWTFKGIFFSVG